MKLEAVTDHAILLNHNKAVLHAVREETTNSLVFCTLLDAALPENRYSNQQPQLTTGQRRMVLPRSMSSCTYAAENVSTRACTTTAKLVISVCTVSKRPIGASADFERLLRSWVNEGVAEAQFREDGECRTRGGRCRRRIHMLTDFHKKAVGTGACRSHRTAIGVNLVVRWLGG